MGHTNYWRPAAVIGDAKWASLCEVTRRIIELAKARGVIVAGLHGEGEPERSPIE